MTLADADLAEYRHLVHRQLNGRAALACGRDRQRQPNYDNVPGGFQDEDDNARFGVKAIDAVMTEKGAPPGSLAYQLASDHGMCAFREGFWGAFTPSQAYLEKRFDADERIFAEPATPFLEAVGEMVDALPRTHGHVEQSAHADSKRHPVRAARSRALQAEGCGAGLVSGGGVRSGVRSVVKVACQIRQGLYAPY